MEKACIGFGLDDVTKAWEHMQFEIIKDYGDYGYGHCLHTWDDGKRMLAKCKVCGGYILIQKSEYHSFSDDGGDSYYSDYFPVESADAAEELNRKYDGFRIEAEFPSRYLCVTNLQLHWSCSETEKKTYGHRKNRKTDSGRAKRGRFNAGKACRKHRRVCSSGQQMGKR